MTPAPRWGLRLLLGALALLPVLLLGGLVVSAELRARRLAEALIVDANTLAAFSKQRPPHREPTPGSVSECLARALDTSPDVSRDAPWMTPQVMNVRAGLEPLETLPSTALDSMTRNDPWLRQTLACTHATSLQPIAGLGPLAEPLHARRQALPKLQEATASLAPLRVRLLVQHGQLREALEVCGDALALVADLLWLEGPEASLGALGQSTGVVRPCADAVWSAEPSLVTAFEGQLLQVSRNTPPYSHVMELERVAQGLRMFGTFFTVDQTSRLPIGARSMVATSASLSRGRQERVGLANWWSSSDRAFKGVIAAADLEEPSRTRAITLAQQGFESRWLKLVRVTPLDVRYQMYAGSHDVLPTAVELLLTTIALKRGATPTTRFIDVKERDGLVSLTPKTSEWVPLSVTLRR